MDNDITKGDDYLEKRKKEKERVRQSRFNFGVVISTLFGFGLGLAVMRFFLSAYMQWVENFFDHNIWLIIPSCIVYIVGVPATITIIFVSFWELYWRCLLREKPMRYVNISKI